MPEHLSSHEDKDSKDDPEEKDQETQERQSWQSPDAAAPEKKSWWEEIEQLKPPTSVIPESEEVRKYAESQGQAKNEWSFGEKKEDDDDEAEEKSEESEKSEEGEVPVAEAQTENTQEQTEATEPTTEDSTVETEPEAERSEEDIEAAKEFAREELEARSAETNEDDPTVDYLEKVVENGNPPEAEQETIEAHGLDEVQAEAEQLVRDIEDLLEKAAEQIGDQELSDEEMLEVAKQIIPETEEPEETELEQPEAFAPTPKAPDTLTSPDSQDGLSRTHNQYHYRQAPISHRTTSGWKPPTQPPSGGGGGGGGWGGSSPMGPGGSARRFASTAAAMNPNLLPIWSRLGSSERARLRDKTLTAALLAGILGYYIGRHYGKKKGESEKAAELEPRLKQQERINKQQNAEIIAGQKRIDSLKRIQAAQEKEAAQQELRESFTTKQRSEKAQISTVSPSSETVPTPAPDHETLASSMPHKRIEAPASLERPAISPDSEAEAKSLPHEDQTALGAPELNQTFRPGADERREFDFAMATEAPYETSSTPGLPAKVSSHLEPEHIRSSGQEHTANSTELPAQPEQSISPPLVPEVAPFFAPRPEIATFTPGIEAPVPTAPELRVGSEPSHIEAFGAQSVETMNVPELLTAAKEMTVGGKNLGQLFQEKQIDATGLRRVMAEYARGGHPEIVLAHERQVAETRHQSAETLREHAAHANGGGGSPSAGGGLFAQTEHPSQQLLPAYDHEQYPSDTPQHLLPAYDQETISKKHHRVIIAASALIGLGVGIMLGLLLI